MIEMYESIRNRILVPGEPCPAKPAHPRLRKVDYFVSHSWGTSFAHFVRSIHCHALSREGQRWRLDV